MWLKPDEYEDFIISCLKATGIHRIERTTRGKLGKSIAVRFSELIGRRIKWL